MEECQGWMRQLLEKLEAQANLKSHNQSPGCQALRCQMNHLKKDIEGYLT